METRVVAVPVPTSAAAPLGGFGDGEGLARLAEWRVLPPGQGQGQGQARDALAVLGDAARRLASRDVPVAFPTETVYGLGADATRSAAVRGIFAAKGRPADNPLIVHVCDLAMLARLLGYGGDGDDGAAEAAIPPRYRPLIERFWPGPLTILLPNPEPSRLAPEVTAGLATFGVRMPASPLALTLIKLAGTPLAAPSANASTRPSPTTAQHVCDDLAGAIELVLDGGPCRVGVESTVVDGLCDPPVVLRPGGVGFHELRRCPGWEHVVKAYEDRAERPAAAPRAPGMKYKHYSPRARVVLYEASCRAAAEGALPSDVEAAQVAAAAAAAAAVSSGRAHQTNGHLPPVGIGLVRTKRWKPGAGLGCDDLQLASAPGADNGYRVFTGHVKDPRGDVIGRLYDIGLGTDTRGIAQGLFSALRELDRRGADTIFIDGIDDDLDMAAAVMNRLRKAASETRA